MRKENLNVNANVLIVDDDENVLYGLVRSLNEQPYKILTAKSGDEAMWILKTREVDVIVADERMPGISGCDLLAWAAENMPNTVRIMLTGNVSASIAIRAINEGRVYHFFTKPCDNVQLAITIRKAIEYRNLVAENDRLLSLNKQQFEKLHQFSKKLGLLARVVAKDLHLPLEKLTHSCATLTNQYGDFFEPKARVLLENALEAVSEVQNLVNKLLDEARLNIQNELPSESPAVQSDMEAVTQDTYVSEWGA